MLRIAETKTPGRVSIVITAIAFIVVESLWEFLAISKVAKFNVCSRDQYVVPE